jgi:biopolymer transport protein TolR
MSMGKGAGGPEMNVTPLIDVLLVLLVIFLLVQSSLKPTGEQALLPQPPDSKTTVEPERGRTVVIRLLPAAEGERPELRINQDAVTWQGLHERLFQIYAARVERVAFVQADRDVDFAYVADVIDAAHSVQVDKVGLLGPEAKAQ